MVLEGTKLLTGQFRQRSVVISLESKATKYGNVSWPGPNRQLSAGCLVQTPLLQASPEEIQSCIEDDQLLLACGKKVPLCTLSGSRSKMPILKGRIAGKTVNVLGDTGCCGILVKRNLVTEKQYIR